MFSTAETGHRVLRHSKQEHCEEGVRHSQGQLRRNQPPSQGYSLRNSYAPPPKKYTEQKAWQEAGVQQPLGKYNTKRKRVDCSGRGLGPGGRSKKE